MKNQVSKMDKPNHLLFLSESMANTMIENCIGTANIPLGLGLNFTINSREYIVPMAVEEPSVIAAVSGAAKLISSSGGFQTKACSRNTVYSQIQMLDITDNQLESIILRVLYFKDEI